MNLFTLVFDLPGEYRQLTSLMRDLSSQGAVTQALENDPLIHNLVIGVDQAIEEIESDLKLVETGGISARFQGAEKFCTDMVPIATTLFGAVSALPGIVEDPVAGPLLMDLMKLIELMSKIALGFNIHIPVPAALTSLISRETATKPAAPVAPVPSAAAPTESVPGDDLDVNADTPTDADMDSSPGLSGVLGGN